MTFVTFDDIFSLFVDICQARCLRCGIWLDPKDFTPSFKDKVYKITERLNRNIEKIFNTSFGIASPGIVVYFKNGSFIKILSAYTTARGYRFDFSAYKYDINKTIVESTIYHCSIAGFLPKSFILDDVGGD